MLGGLYRLAANVQRQGKLFERATGTLAPVTGNMLQTFDTLTGSAPAVKGQPHVAHLMVLSLPPGCMRPFEESMLDPLTARDNMHNTHNIRAY